MKKLFLVLLSLSFSFTMLAQKVEIYGYGGYTLNGKINTYYGKFNVADNGNYGAHLAIKTHKDGFVELWYNRNETSFNYNRAGFISATYGIATEYYQVGGLQQIDTGGKFKPYGSFSLGATRFHALERIDEDGDGTYVDVSDTWTFSGTLAAGVKVYLTERVGIRAQARMLLPMQFSGLMLGIGTGGVSGGAGFTVPMISGDFTGGIFLAF